MRVVGIDLSGPANVADTAVSVFLERGNTLLLESSILGVSDRDLLDLTGALMDQGSVVLGIDAPLSFNPGGGLRPADKELKKRTIAAGLHPGSVMPPTLNRMVYLTLRGMGLARVLELEHPQKLRITEVHPGASLALQGAPINAVKNFKKIPAARVELFNWMESQGLIGLREKNDSSDHGVAACAAAFAAWKWAQKKSSWLCKAELPFHPYDFAV